MATTQNSARKRRAAASADTDGSGVPALLSREPEAQREYYRKMVQIRLFEEACQRGFREGKVGGYLHLYIGQEAVATGLIDALQAGRQGHHRLSRSRPRPRCWAPTPREVMAELYGKGTGLVKGKGGSMHLFDVETRLLWAATASSAGTSPLGVGMAYSLRYQGTDRIVQLYFGDGAMNNGAFHEATNMAGLWGKEGMCPCLFILENNLYAMGTSVERPPPMTDLGSKFDSYNIPHEKVDGMDLDAVMRRRRTGRAARSARPANRTPRDDDLSLLPHGAADILERYRSKEEVEEARKRDPINPMNTNWSRAARRPRSDVEEIRDGREGGGR